MTMSLRQKTAALLAVAVLVALASPAVATPSHEPARANSLSGPSLFATVWAWLSDTFDEEAPQSLSAHGGAGMEPEGSTETTDVESDPGDSVTPQSGHGMDPNG